MEHARGASTLTDAFDHYCSGFECNTVSRAKRKEEKKMQLIVKDDI
jgi:hypothetical protein